MTCAGLIEVSRVYEPRAPAQGLRVLVGRLWSRGLSKTDADLDFWCQDSAPSSALRVWYGHAAERSTSSATATRPNSRTQPMPSR
jgi:uncharacterized protein YeaO (DUF488 family)